MQHHDGGALHDRVSPQVELAATSWVWLAVSSVLKYVFTGNDTETCRKGYGATEEGGAVTPGTVLGKVQETVAAPPLYPLNPFLLAYQHMVGPLEP
jgi:hypothetical protein